MKSNDIPSIFFSAISNLKKAGSHPYKGAHFMKKDSEFKQDKKLRDKLCRRKINRLGNTSAYPQVT